MPINPGLVYALAAYLTWGGVVLYWKQLAGIPSDQILCFRVICSLPILIPIIKFSGLWAEFQIALRSRQHLIAAVIGAILISINWLLFIWGVNTGQIVQISLGYFICPLAAVVFGMLFFGERLGLAQLIAFGLACVGVLHQASILNQIPWLALGVAISFGLYAVSRKASKLHSLVALTLDSLVLLPISVIYLIISHLFSERMYDYSDLGLDLWLSISGVMTALPLLWYSLGAQRLTLRTLGFLHYIAPSMQLALGVLLYNEAFDSNQRTSFIIIWVAVLIFITDSLLRHSRNRGIASTIEV